MHTSTPTLKSRTHTNRPTLHTHEHAHDHSKTLHASMKTTAPNTHDHLYKTAQLGTQKPRPSDHRTITRASSLPTPVRLDFEGSSVTEDEENPAPRQHAYRMKGEPSLKPQRKTRSESPAKRPPSPQKISARKKEKALASPIYNQDRLGTLISMLTDQLAQADTWEEFVTRVHGPAHHSTRLEDLQHPAREHLTDLRDRGVPVLVRNGEWTKEEIEMAMERGAHKSARDHKEFIRDEMADFIEKGFWVVLPYHLVKDLPRLRLSPLGVKEERDRRPRLVVDHSFFDVNEDTETYTPEEAMQYGAALPRILYRLRHANPGHGTISLAKWDVKDGFYKGHLVPGHAPTLGVIMPRYDNEPPLVAIPLVCTMGWTNSPPSFCALTETIADRANRRVADGTTAVPHKLDEHCEPMDDSIQEDIAALHRLPPPPGLHEALELLPSLPEPPDDTYCGVIHEPLEYADVFVDDFIGLVQGAPPRRNNLRRHLFHAVDEVLDEGREAVSLKKLLKGDGSWGTHKIILGWLINTIDKTIELAPHRREKLWHLFHSLKGKKRVGLTKWQQTIGELRSLSIALPGSGGLFSALQLGIKHADKHRIRITKHIRAHLDDFKRIAASLVSRPSRWDEIVPGVPTVIGASDAAKAGMGGVFFAQDERPCVWRTPFPQDIQGEVVSDDNPSGRLTNSDLEQAGILGQLDVTTQRFDTRGQTTAVLSDNTPAVSRFHKKSMTSDQAGAYLCRLASLHKRHYRYCTEISYIAGPANVMSDDASRLQHLSDSALLSYFDSTYPQSKPWQLCHLNTKMRSAILSLLRRKPLKTTSFLRQSPGETRLGSCGPSFVKPGKWIPHSPVHPTSWTGSSSSGTCIVKDSSQGVEKVVSPSGMEQWRKPYAPWERGSPTWVSRTRGWTRGDTTSHASKPWYKPTNGTTQSLREPGPSPSPSSTPSSASRFRPSGPWSTNCHETWQSSGSTSSADLENTPPPGLATKAGVPPSAYKTSASGQVLADISPRASVL